MIFFSKLAPSLKNAWRELKSSPKFFLFFSFNLGLGLMGIIAVEGFRSGMQEIFQGRSKQILGANLEISGRQDLTAPKLKEVLAELRSKLSLAPEDHLKVLHTRSVYNMLGFAEQTRLVHVKAYPEGFPFYGELVLEGDGAAKDFRSDGESMWIYPELSHQLGIVPGDEIQLGHATFKVKAVVKDDPQQGFSAMSLAPRVFISLKGLERAGLIQTGSIVWYGTHLYWPGAQTLTSEQILELNQFIDNEAINVLTPERSSEQISRIFDYVSDFLGLVSLVALFLATIGVTYLYRTYLAERKKQMALYLSLGMSPWQVVLNYLFQLMILGFFGAILGIFGGEFVLRLALVFLAPYLEISLEGVTALTPNGLFLGVLISMTGLVLLALPLLYPITEIRPLHLLQEFSEQEKRKKRKIKEVILWSLWPLFYLALALSISNSPRIGGLFFLVFMGTPLLIYPVANFTLKRLLFLRKSLRFVPKMALLYMARFRVGTIISFLSLTLVALLLNIIPMIQGGLVEELLGEDRLERPNFFLFDIQEEEIESLENFLKKKKFPLIDISPMVRGRLTHVNGEPFKRDLAQEHRTREEQERAHFRNRGLNLSYRDDLNPSEELIRGRFPRAFDWDRDSVAEVSLERRYAQRMGLNMGDIITVDILGLSIDAEIVGLRRVQWTSFLPNFFILFGPGVFEDAPKTFLAAVGQMNSHQRLEFQNEMFREFPTVSLVDTSRVVEKVLQLMGQTTRALLFMSILSFIVGGLVLFSLMSHQIQMKKRDVALLKAQGLSHTKLARILRVEFLSVALAASFTGALIGIITSVSVSFLFFDGVWVFKPLVPLGVSVLICGMVFLLCEIFTKLAFKIPAQTLLQEEASF